MRRPPRGPQFPLYGLGGRTCAAGERGRLARRTQWPGVGAQGGAARPRKKGRGGALGLPGPHSPTRRHLTATPLRGLRVPGSCQPSDECSSGLAYLSRTAAITSATRASGQTTPPAAPGPRSSSRWPIVERSPRRSHPFILLYPIRTHRTRKPRPCLARTRPRARVPSCPARGGRRPRGDARTSGVRAQPRNALTHACQQPQALGEGRAKPHQVRQQVRAYCLHTPEGAEIR